MRSRWNTGRDRIIAALIVVVCLVAGLIVWAFSDARATTLRTAPQAPELPAAPPEVPATLTQAWQARSPATREPVVIGPTVVTAGHGDVTGRDALTGEARWQYARSLPLCDVAGVFSKVLVMHRKDSGCSEVTQLDPETGERTAQRNSNAGPGARLVTDCSYPAAEYAGTDPSGQRQTCGYVTTTGRTLLNTWRSDLVKTAEYGDVPALIQPGKQPRPGCEYGTVASAAGRVGVIERCPDDPHARLTVYDAGPENWDDPEVVFTVVLANSPAKLVAMSEEVVAISVPGTRSLVRYDMNGNKLHGYELNVSSEQLKAQGRDGIVPRARGTNGVYWFTGSSTVALSPRDLEPRWTLPHSLGAGTMFAGEYVVPVEGGLAVLDQRSGRTERTVAVDRGSYSGRVVLDATGPVLVEQRGDNLVALR